MVFVLIISLDFSERLTNESDSSIAARGTPLVKFRSTTQSRADLGGTAMFRVLLLGPSMLAWKLCRCRDERLCALQIIFELPV